MRRAQFVTRDHAITRIACRDPGRGSECGCSRGDSPQPTVAPCPPPRSSTTLRNSEQGWPGAFARAWRIRIMKSPLEMRSSLVSNHENRDHSLSFSPSLFSSVRCPHLLATGTGRTGLSQFFFHSTICRDNLAWRLIIFQNTTVSKQSMNFEKFL